MALGALSAALGPTLAEATTPRLAPRCPLPVNVAATFLNSPCTKTLLTQPQTIDRHFSTDSKRYGRYPTPDRFLANTGASRPLAL